MTKQRGRKKRPELSMVPVSLKTRPSPPKEFTKEQAKEWDAIVNRLPVDWFPEESWPILKCLCRHIVNADVLAEQINNLPKDLEQTKVRKELLSMHEKESRVIQSCSTKLRLTTQSRIQPVSASRQADGVKSKKPWEFGS